METNIDISTINKYFSRDKEKESVISGVLRTKIVNYSHFSINEVCSLLVIHFLLYPLNRFCCKA